MQQLNQLLITEIEPDLTNVSAISKACSPVSGCEINNSSVLHQVFLHKLDP